MTTRMGGRRKEGKTVNKKVSQNWGKGHVDKKREKERKKERRGKGWKEAMRGQ